MKLMFFVPELGIWWQAYRLTHSQSKYAWLDPWRASTPTEAMGYIRNALHVIYKESGE